MKNLLCILLSTFSLSLFAQFTEITSPASYMNGSKFFSEDMGIIYEEQGVLHKTIDGGQTWDTVQTGYGSSLTDIYFISEDEFVVTGGAFFPTQFYLANLIVKTENGGADFDLLFGDQASGVMSKVAFADAENGLFLGGYISFKTEDGGATLDTFETDDFPQNIGGLNIRAAEFIDEQNILVLGAQYVNNYGFIHQIVKSTDGGNNFTVVNSDSIPSWNPYADMQFISNNNGYAVGPGGYFIKTDNGGLDWQKFGIADSVNLNDVHFVNSAVGFISGTHVSNNTGYLFQTEDAGATWNTMIIDTAFGVSHMSVVNNKIIMSDLYKLFSHEFDTALLSLGINDVNKNEILVFPNPASNYITLNSTFSRGSTLAICNINGRTLLRRKINSDMQQFDVSQFPAGNYCVTISEKSGQIHTQKLVIAKN